MFLMFQGEKRAFTMRWFTGKFMMIYFGFVAGNYYFKYNANVSIYTAFY